MPENFCKKIKNGGLTNNTAESIIMRAILREDSKKEKMNV